MQAKRPIIAVTGPDRGGWPAWVFTALAVRRSGGSPLRLRPGAYANSRPLPVFDGLILGGGADIEPSKAGIALDALLPSQEARKNGPSGILSWIFAPLILLLRRFLATHDAGIDEARDLFEEHCLKVALENGRPILGICRGAQLLNVHFGGTLHGELSGFYGESGNPDSVYPRKRVEIVHDSLLSSIVRHKSLLVNSLHKQAVNQTGKGVDVSARDDSGVIQAIESRNNGWVVGVQWHPEFLPAFAAHQRIFRDLVANARRNFREDHFSPHRVNKS